MEIAKLTSKGQITIPKTVRDELGVDTGDKLIFVRCESGYLVCNGDNFNLNLSEEPLDAAETLPPVREARQVSARPVKKLEVSDYFEEEEDREEKSSKGKDKDKDKDKDKKKKKKKKK